MRQDPIHLIESTDVLILGGGSAGVAAAVHAANAGARVFIAAAEMYFGEDLCATAALWREPGDADAMTRWFGPDRPLTPMQVKAALDDRLLDANVRFLFGCLPIDVLRDETGSLAGMVLATRSGPVAIKARAVIDATPFALAARQAGVAFTPWSDAPISASRTLLAATSETDPDGQRGRRLAPPIVFETTDRKGDPLTEQGDAWLYAQDIRLPEFSPAALGDAEDQVRDQVWSRNQCWASDRIDFLPPDRIDAPVASWPIADAGRSLKAMDGLWVLGACSPLDDAGRAKLIAPGGGIAPGEALGKAVARIAPQRLIGDDLRPGRADAAAPTAGVREPLRADRFLRASQGVLDHPRHLDVLAEVDVLIAGGGTGGGPAGIAAAREGASTLVIEYLSDLGGVGTTGMITSYYHGFREGFTAEVDAGVARFTDEPDVIKQRWNADHKAEWLRRSIREAGGAIWRQAIITGALVEDGVVRGVTVATPAGYGVVRAKAVVDCTGNADVAAAAGAETVAIGAGHMAVQGSGLPPRGFRPEYRNSDYTFIEDADPTDASRAMVVGRRKFRGQFDMGQLPDTRERRQIVGDCVVSPLDAYAGRTWPDAVALSRSNFDTHGFTIHPMFFVMPPDRQSIDAWLPLGAMLPRGLAGVAVTGLGLSGHRDVMPVLRMQACVQNHSYAAGLAAVQAARWQGEFRSIDLPALQKRLVDMGILPEAGLRGDRSFPLPDDDVRAAVAGPLDAHADLAVVLAHPDVAAPALRDRLASEAEPTVRERIARLLAVLGDSAGADLLIQRIDEPWDEGWNYTGMGQFGRSFSEQDACIMLLGMLCCRDAFDLILRKTGELTVDDAFSHARAVGFYFGEMADPAAAPVLAEALGKPGVAGHAWTTLADELADIPESGVDTTTRNRSLREIELARALLRCGDHNGVGRTILERYSQDIRGQFARHAAAVLASAPAPSAVRVTA